MSDNPDHPRPALDVAVLMRRERVPGPMSRWQTWRWVLDDVVRDEAHHHAQGSAPRRWPEPAPDLAAATAAAPAAATDAATSGAAADEVQRWLFPGYRVELFADDLEGYALNASTAAPCWFVLWRMQEAPDVPDAPEAALAVPHTVTLSYHDAGRWLDAQETVEQVPLPAEVCDWLRAHVAAHDQPEPRRRQRPQSFQALSDRFGSPASVSTGPRRGGGAGRG